MGNNGVRGKLGANVSFPLPPQEVRFTIDKQVAEFLHNQGFDYLETKPARSEHFKPTSQFGKTQASLYPDLFQYFGPLIAIYNSIPLGKITASFLASIYDEDWEKYPQQIKYDLAHYRFHSVSAPDLNALRNTLSAQFNCSLPKTETIPIAWLTDDQGRQAVYIPDSNLVMIDNSITDISRLDVHRTQRTTAAIAITLPQLIWSHLESSQSSVYI